MKAAFLINERTLRQKLARAIESPDLQIEEFPTASKALAKRAASPAERVNRVPANRYWLKS